MTKLRQITTATLALLLGAACKSPAPVHGLTTGSGGMTSGTGGTGGTGGAGGTTGTTGTGGAAMLAVTPPTANVLTCSTLPLQETGGTGKGTWSVSPAGAGSVAATGLYSAPTVAPASPAVSVSYTEGAESASAALQVATAFPGAPVDLAVGGDGNLGNVPFDHQITASGAQAYAGVIGADFLSANIFASADGGHTFAAPTTYHTGDVNCVTVAVDAGSPQVVYLVYAAGHGDSTTNTGGTVRLAVSTDGAKTFPVEYVIADSLNGIANMICPDVISPSPGHVLVVGAVDDLGVGNAPAHVGAFASGGQGASIGPVGAQGQLSAEAPPDGSVYYAPSDTNGAATQTQYPIACNGNGDSPRTGTNGKGAVCMVFQYNGGNSPNPTMVQCSQDAGATWTVPVNLGAPSADAQIHPTVAVSPGGKVVVAWIDTVSTAIQSFVALSTDGGKTFAAPIQYPALAAMPGGVSDPVVAWESDDILWISETANVGNANTIFVDKTCDDGQTWSGAVQVAKLTGTSLVKTTTGMLVGGYDTQVPSLSATSLDAP